VPTHGTKLWVKGEVRPIRFHDLRHTTANLLLMGGANPAAVQRILRHSDPKTTTEVYGHLAPGDLKAEIDRLAFGDRAAAVVPEVPAEVAASARAASVATPLLRSGQGEKGRAGSRGKNDPRNPALRCGAR